MYLPLIYDGFVAVPNKYGHTQRCGMSERYYFGFAFYKVDPKWRWLADLGKAESAKEVQQVLGNTGVRFRTYSTVGLRADADLLLWTGSKIITDIQKVSSRLYGTVFGKYIMPTLNYISCTRPSAYAAGGSLPSFMGDMPPKKYAIVYPFTKTREWYLLPSKERQDMMDEHIAVGRRYPDVILNTTYSFGLDDHDFMLAFETDELPHFQDLIMDLRATKVSRYVKSDTPMIVCVKKDIMPLIASMG